MQSTHSLPMPGFGDTDFSAAVRLTVQNDHIPHEDKIAAFSNFGEPFPDWNFPACEHEFQHNQPRAVQQERLYHNDDGDTEHVADMWRNWINLTSEPLSLACISAASPNFSSQTSASFPANGCTSSPMVINTSSIQASSLPSTASRAASLYSLYEENRVTTHLETVESSSSPLETNFMAPARQPTSQLKVKAGPRKMKTAGATKNFRNNGTKKEEVQTYLVESTEDGYAWHKYGQKRIKNRMHPRCYFKCSHTKCPVKKRTESSSDMQGFFLITYINKHNHLQLHAQA